jgi:hypothetical protein
LAPARDIFLAGADDGGAARRCPAIQHLEAPTHRGPGDRTVIVQRPAGADRRAPGGAAGRHVCDTAIVDSRADRKTAGFDRQRHAIADDDAVRAAVDVELRSAIERQAQRGAAGQNDFLGAAVHHGIAGTAAGLDHLRSREHRRAAGHAINVLHAAGNSSAPIGAAGADGFRAAAGDGDGVGEPIREHEQPAAADNAVARGAAGRDDLGSGENGDAAGQSGHDLRTARDQRALVGAAGTDDFTAAAKNHRRISDATRQDDERTAAQHRTIGRRAGFHRQFTVAEDND